MCQRDPIQCIIPPYITERLLRSDDAEVRARAEANLTAAANMRAARARARAAPSLMAAIYRSCPSWRCSAPILE